MSCVMVPILVDTNPYSWEKRKYGEVSGSGHAAYTLSIRTRITRRTFSAAWNIRYPDTSLKRGVSRPVNVLIFLDLPRIMECRWWTLQFLPFIFTKIPRYGLCYPNLYSKRSRHVKILFRRMRWNSTIHEVSSVFTSPKFHGTWNIRDSKHHWNSTVHEITDVEIEAKLPDTRKLQHVYSTKFDDTFNFYARYWK